MASYNLSKQEIIEKVTGDGLLPDKEIRKFKIYLNNSNDIDNILKAFDKFKDENKKHYLSEFLTIKNRNEQANFLKLNTGIRGFLKNINNTKIEKVYKTSKGIATTKIVALMTTGTLPGLYIAGAVVARLTAPIAINYFTDNFANNNITLKHIQKRISSIKKEFENDLPSKNKHLNRVFKLIPESIYYNNSMPINKKEEFLNTSINMLKSCDRYIKILLKKQQPQTVFNFLNILREEIEKRGITIEEATKKSRFFSNEGFASLQSHIFLKMLENKNNMLSIITKAKEVEKAVGDEFVEDAMGIFGKITEKTSIYKNINFTENKVFEKIIKIENITDPKSLYKDVISSNIEERIFNQSKELKELINTSESIINDTTNFMDDIIDVFIKNDKVNSIAKLSIAKPINMVSEKVKDIPKICSEKITEYSLKVNEKIERLDELIQKGKIHGKFGSKYPCIMVDFLKEITKKAIKNVIDFIDANIPIKDFIKDTKKEVLMIWNFYDKFKDGIRWGIVEGAGLLTRTTPKFEKNFQNHEILNHKNKLTSGIKSQLNHIKKNAEKLNMTGPGDNIERKMKNI